MRKTLKRLTALLAVLLVMVSGSAVVYADTYHELRDTEIELLLPDSWEYDEVDRSVSEGYSYEWIADVYENVNDDSELWMGLYYMHDFIGGADVCNITGDDDGQEYFGLYGKDAIETLYDELDWGESIEFGEVSLYEGEYGDQLMVPIEGDYGDGTTFYHVIYLDCETVYEENEDGERAVVHMIKMFYRNDELPMDAADIKTAEEIADNFYDYGYYEKGYFGKGGMGSEIFDFILTILPFVVLIPGMIAAGIKKLPDLLGESERTSKKNKQKKKKPTPMPVEKSSFGKKGRKQMMSEIKKYERKPMKDRSLERAIDSGSKKAMTSEERYLQSLHTLRKSGLLTREEMADMLERHERNRNSRRRN